MPRDANGVYTLPPSYHVQTGDTVLPVQHNPPFEDVANALTNSIDRDGRTVMTGNLQMGGNRITNVAPGSLGGDVATLKQVGQKASFKTVQDLLADASMSYTTGPIFVEDGDIITAQGFRYEVAASDAIDWHVETAAGVKLKVLSAPLQPQMLGAEATQANDNTRIIQKCLDILEGAGGGQLHLPAGDYMISMAQSDHGHACILIPENVEIFGDGASTLISRPSGERSTNGILMVNKGYDTEGGYEASGNIIVRDFSITDGDAPGSRGLGDLLAFGHAKRVRVERIYGGNHDQHLVDICSCDDVRIENCVSRQNLPHGIAVFQVDGSDSLGIWGLLLDNTPTKNIIIDGNDVVTLGNGAVHLFHAANTHYENIRITNNRFEAGRVEGTAAIYCDNLSYTVDGLSILDNEIYIDAVDSRGINLFCARATSIKDVKIRGNTIKGRGRSGIYAGTNVSDTTPLTDKWVAVLISENNVDLDTTASTNQPYALSIYGVSGMISNNLFSVRSSDGATNPMLIASPRGLIVSDNDFHAESSVASSLIYIEKQLIAPTELYLRGNKIGGDNVSLHIGYGAGWDASVDRHVVSGNQFEGDPSIAHIVETFAVSDGTNGWHQVDLSSIGAVTNGAVAISSNRYYPNIPIGLKKSGTNQMSRARIELQFVPVSINDFGTDVEDLMFAITDTGTRACAGTQVCDVNQLIGMFSILTGSAGVQVVINNASGNAVIRGSGFIKAYAGI